MSDFFERLFAKNQGEEIAWSVHTTMTCDTAYTAALLEKQLDCRGMLGERAENGVDFFEKMGVFYHRNPSKRKQPTLSVCNKDIPLERIAALQFGVSAKTTLHAKLSLVCIANGGERRYRIAVYSKNMEFHASCAEAAMLFDLVKLEGSQRFPTNTDRLKQFFGILYDQSSKEDCGQKWLEKHGLHPDGYVWDDIRGCQIIGTLFGAEEVSREVGLFFGGCGDAKTLGQRLELDKATNRSIVLTPPFFLYQKKAEKSKDAELAGTEFLNEMPVEESANASNDKYQYSKAWEYFRDNQNAPQLYDLKKENKIERTSSHIKAYLLEKENDNDKIYEFWIGSANATERGIGWNFAEQSRSIPENIECLIMFSLTEVEFNDLRKAICSTYQPFSFNPKDSSLKVNSDCFGPYFCSNYEAKTLVYRDKNGEEVKSRHHTDAKKLQVTFKYIGSTERQEKEMFFPEQMIWHPAEYGFNQPITGDEKQAIEQHNEVTLSIAFSKFKASQGFLCVGRSNCMMSIAHLLEKSEIPRESSKKPDISLTEWLLNETDMPKEDELSDKPDRLQWMYRVLTNDADPEDLYIPVNTAVQMSVQAAEGQGKAIETDEFLIEASEECAKLLKPKQLQFQKNATARLYHILQNNSRAFLADEAGLGKTYSAAGVIFKLAEKQWEDQGAGNETPFYALYVAPNRDLLQKNGDDIVDKMEQDFLVGTDIKILFLGSSSAIEKYKIEKKYKKDAQDKIEREKRKIEKACEKLFRQLREPEVLEEICRKLPASYPEIHPQTFVENVKIYQSSRKKAVREKLWSVYELSGKWDNKKNKLEKWWNFQKDCREWVIKYKEQKKRDEIDKWLKHQLELLDKTKITKSTDKNDKDRIAFADQCLETITPEGKYIVLIPLSVNLLFDDRTPSHDEKELLEGKCRSRYTIEFLERYQPGIILWDEFHRYHKKTNESFIVEREMTVEGFRVEGIKEDKWIDNPIVKWEIASHSSRTIRPMKSLFISATPYQTNISGEESNALDSLYSFDEEEKLEILPSFDEFVELYCAGCNKELQDSYWKSGREYEVAFAGKLKSLHNGFLNTLDLDTDVLKLFESNLKIRMVRHERTRLQKQQEVHRQLYPAKELYQKEYAKILYNTFRQSKLLKEAGYSDATLKWSWNLPWILSFSTKNKNAMIKNTEEKANYFNCLDPNDNKRPTEELYAYDENGNPKSCLENLPNESLPIGQICRENLSDTMTQLLWMPPTVPLYQPEGIYKTYEGYSKLLVFAEYRYLQRGGAALLSDYTKLKNMQKATIPENFPLALNCLCFVEEFFEKDQFSLTDYDFRSFSLDEVIEVVQEKCKITNNKDALTLIASPAACAKYLGMDTNIIEKAFNTYFKRDGVREALWAWMCDRGYCNEDKWSEGILRYCAEGNLYAVLEEYQFACKGDLFENLQKVLYSDGKNNPYKPSKVFVQTLDTSMKRENGKQRNCSFADRLTNDTNDSGVGASKVSNGKEKEEVRTAVAAAFSSPFWPMILFAGRGAQEGMDFHQYCLRIMHLTLPRGAVSLEQRQGRIDRFRSLLVRRRAAEQLEGLKVKTTERMMERMFAHLDHNKYQGENVDNQIYPHWSIPNAESRWHFQRMLPFWEFTEESKAANILENMRASYLVGFGIRPGAAAEHSINLSAPNVKESEDKMS